MKGKRKREITFYEIDKDWQLLLDPENIFWGIIPREDGKFTVPEGMFDLYNKERDHLDQEMYEFRFNEPLNCVYIDPTDRCNANCPYCYIPAKIRKTGTQMSPEQLDTVLSKIEEHFSGAKKKPVIVFHAAEPLLVKDMLFDAIERYKKRFLFGIQTNALLLEQEDVEFMKKNRIGVGISLDAAQEELNNKSRVSLKGDGNFRRAVQAIEWFDGYEGLNVICTVTKYNVDRLSELVKFLHKRRVPLVLLNPVRLTQQRAIRLRPDDRVFAESLIDAVNTAVDLTRKTGRQIVIGNFANIILAIVSPTARRMMCDISPCGGGRTFLTITADGSMIPCGEFIGFKEFSGGNIFKHPISRAMDSRAFKKIRSRVVERIDECRECEFRHICGSPCPAEMYARGDMYRKAVFCDYYKEMIRYAFKMIAEDRVKYLLRQDAFNQMVYEYRF